MAVSIKESLALSAQQLSKAARELLGRTEAGEEVSIRDIKELTAVLKELLSLENTLAGESRAESIRVVFEGEAEEWSK